MCGKFVMYKQGSRSPEAGGHQDPRNGNVEMRGVSLSENLDLVCCEMPLSEYHPAEPN